MSHRAVHRADAGESSSLASVLHDSGDAGILIIGANDHVICCTPEAERILRVAPGKLNGAALNNLPPPIQQLARDAAASRSAVATRIVAIGNFHIRIAAVPFTTSDGKVQLVITVNTLSLAGRLEANIHHLDRLASVGTLSAGLAHEIKNAFVAIKTFVDLLLDNNRDAELADVVRREMRRIDSIVSQMLRFSAPTRPNFAKVRIHDVLDHSLRMLQHQFEAKLISLTRQFDATSDSLQGDEHQLEQAFLNLLLNALEAMGPNGSLIITTSMDNGTSGSQKQICIGIADNGVGIAPENMQRLYEPFFTTKQHGTGLGLAIVRRIVREHHGEISVESEPTKGTRVKILLPATAA